MAARLTAAEARALGLTPPPAAKATRSRRQAAGPQVLRCHACGEVLTGDTAQRRHADETGHARQDIVLA